MRGSIRASDTTERPAVGTREADASGRRVASRRGSDPLRRLARHPQGVIGGAIMAGLVLVAALAPLLVRQSPDAVNIDQRFLPVSLAHPFGTDDLGRDVFARVVYGSRVALLAGFVTSALAAVVGTFCGIVSGYFGKRTDNVIMRLTDAFLAFPSLVLLIAFAATFGPGLVNAMVAIGISAVPVFTRHLRGVTLAVRSRDFVEAARAQGSGVWRILGRHILPNTLPLVLVLGSLQVGGAILAESGLSYLGLGTQPPTPSWGSMITQGNAYLQLAPWIAIFPGAAIFVTVLGANLLGDALRDVLDPRLRGMLR
jgi:peptide/nickel transport system permease protein